MAIKNIYTSEFNATTDIEQHLFDEVLRIMNKAIDSGIKHIQTAGEFTNQLKTNNEVWSAFKVHRAQNDIASKLLDDTGKLKPFAKFFDEVLPIADHQCRDWMKTEYDTAVIRAQHAANWKQYQAESDVLPNLEWMPTTSITPGEDHRPFWGSVYPVNSPAWNNHRPGDRWNCKCGLRQTDKSVQVATKEAKTQFPPSPGLDNNPAIDGHIFSKTHPYITQAYPGAEKAVKTFLKNN